MSNLTKKPGQPGQPRKYYSVDRMQAEIDKYFDRIEASKREIVNSKTGIPTVFQEAPYWTELCLALGFSSRQSAVPYLMGDYDSDDNRFSDCLARARARIESILAKGSVEKVFDSNTVKAVLQNLHDYAERTEIKAEMTAIAQINEAELETKLEKLLSRYQKKELPPYGQ